MKRVNDRDREQLLITYLQENIAPVLGLKGNKLPAIDQDLLGQGMDSLMIMQVITKMKQDLQIRCTPGNFTKGRPLLNLRPILQRNLSKCMARQKLPPFLLLHPLVQPSLF
ncbi:MAG: acyl carrier protein [Synechococcaceae cyanobacterium RL_1_2]|nr:acyl carrier protein [Synechococcaceae cyanobacterium RL_1_2]